MLRIALSYLNFYRDTRGLTVVEYAVAGALIAAAVVAAFILLGDNVEGEINRLAGEIDSGR